MGTRGMLGPVVTNVLGALSPIGPEIAFGTPCCGANGITCLSTTSNPSGCAPIWGRCSLPLFVDVATIVLFLLPTAMVVEVIIFHWRWWIHCSLRVNIMISS